MRFTRSSTLVPLAACAALVALVATAGLQRAVQPLAALEPAATSAPAAIPHASAELGQVPASAGTRAIPEPAIRGRLVDTQSGAPVAGWTVQLTRPAPRTAPRKAPTSFVIHRRGGAGAEVGLAQADPGATIRIEAGELRLIETSLAVRLAGSGTIPLGSGKPALNGSAPDGAATADAPLPGSAPTGRAPASAPLFLVRATAGVTLGPEGIAPASVEVAGDDPPRTLRVFEPGVVALAGAPSALLWAGSGVASRVEFATGPELEDAGGPSALQEERLLVDECTTDAEGRFEFRCSDEEGLWLELVDRPPLYAGRRPATRRLPPDACVAPFDWRVGIHARAHVQGRVVDVANGEGVPDLEVELRGPDGLVERVTTDAEGRFTSAYLFAQGTLRATFLDGPDECPVACADARAEVGSESGACTFHVAIGPTYRCAWRSGSAPDEARVRLRGATLAARDDGACAGSGWLALRSGDEAWVRFPAPLRTVPGETPRLEFVAADGLLRASVALPHRMGRGADPIRVAFDLAAVVRGRVRDAEGEPVAGARVVVRDASGRALDEVHSSARGDYAVPGLDPRAVATVEAASRRSARHVTLASGQDLEVDLVLD